VVASGGGASILATIVSGALRSRKKKTLGSNLLGRGAVALSVGRIR